MSKQPNVTSNRPNKSEAADSFSAESEQKIVEQEAAADIDEENQEPKVNDEEQNNRRNNSFDKTRTKERKPNSVIAKKTIGTTQGCLLKAIASHKVVAAIIFVLILAVAATVIIVPVSVKQR
jgi:uncharacterized membrane protein YdbT with pleckstrin-like domain